MDIEISKDELSGEQLARMFRALADETRLAIFQLLRRDCCSPDGKALSGNDIQRTVSSIAETFGIAISTVSHHLKELRHAGLIVCQKQGQRLHCRINEAAIERLGAYFGEP